MEEKKRIINKFEIIISIIAIGIMVVLFLRSKGIHMTTVSENTEIIDNPTSNKSYKKKEQTTETKRRNREVEDMLKHLDGRKDKRKYDPNPISSATEASSNRTADEERFFQNITDKYHQVDDENVDVYQVLKNSKNTYFKVRDFFRDPVDANKSEFEKMADDVGFLLQNETVAQQIYKQIEEQFSIPAEKSEAFAAQGKKAISDWASFVEENKTKE